MNRNNGLQALAAISLLMMNTAFADILYLDLRGTVKVNGEAKEGAVIEVIPCDGARLPSDWPAPAPFAVSTAVDPATGLNYLVEFTTLFGVPATAGPAGSFTFLSPLNGAWYTAIDCQLKISYSNCPPITVSCDAVRAAYEATLTGSQVGLPIMDFNIPSCSQFVPGDTAGIGFWANKNGQELIKSLNGGPASTALANWLASNFPYLFGANAGANNLTGKSNLGVASACTKLASQKGMKVDAQILATALATYVTDSDLAGSAGSRYGFNVSTSGLGEKTYNVGLNGSAIGLTDNAEVSVFGLLQQANLMKQTGLFNQSAFKQIFSSINESGERP